MGRPALEGLGRAVGGATRHYRTPSCAEAPGSFLIRSNVMPLSHRAGKGRIRITICKVFIEKNQLMVAAVEA